MSQDPVCSVARHTTYARRIHDYYEIPELAQDFIVIMNELVHGFYESDETVKDHRSMTEPSDL